MVDDLIIVLQCYSTFLSAIPSQYNIGKIETLITPFFRYKLKCGKRLLICAFDNPGVVKILFATAA